MLGTYDTNVYVAGGFTMAGNRPAASVARFAGGRWTGLASTSGATLRGLAGAVLSLAFVAPPPRRAVAGDARPRRPAACLLVVGRFDRIGPGAAVGAARLCTLPPLLSEGAYDGAWEPVHVDDDALEVSAIYAYPSAR